MNRRRIEQFLSTLAHEIDLAARAYVTGAAAAALWGHVRPSLDIDLGIDLRAPSPEAWEAVHRAARRTTALTGIATSVAEDIDRWGMITLLDYKRSSRLYKKFGRLEVRLLHPINWSIGKLTRRLDVDIDDVAQVLRRQKVSPDRAARTWGRALRSSPASTAQFQFRENVESFFSEQGRRIWGHPFQAPVTIRIFRTAAGIRAPAPAPTAGVGRRSARRRPS